MCVQYVQQIIFQKDDDPRNQETTVKVHVMCWVALQAHASEFAQDDDGDDENTLFLKCTQMERRKKSEMQEPRTRKRGMEGGRGLVMVRWRKHPWR